MSEMFTLKIVLLILLIQITQNRLTECCQVEVFFRALFCHIHIDL